LLQKDAKPGDVSIVGGYQPMYTEPIRKSQKQVKKDTAPKKPDIEIA